MTTSSSPIARKTVVAGAIGNMLEWYDFALYGYFAPVFASLFFPSEYPSVSLISAFGVFAIGFLARPLGALLFGYVGDTVGRREALAWSVILMSIPTCGVGFLPTFDAVGVAAPLALTFFRFLQGLSVGGEFTGSATFLVEHAPSSRRGYTGSWAGFSAQIGALLGSAVSTLVMLSVTEEALHQWAWRIPFVLGSLIGVVGWYLRRRIAESPAFEHARQAGDLSATPIHDVFTSQRVALVRLIGLVWLHGVAFYLLYVYLTTYLMMMTSVPRGIVLTINTICMALLAILIPVMGHLSDRIGQKLLLLVGAAGLTTTSYPLFLLLSTSQPAFILTAQLLLTGLVACYMGPFFAATAALFPTAQRYTGLSVGYNIGSALFGGTAPLVATLLIEWTGNSLAPGIYLSFSGLIALTVVWTLPKDR